MRVGILLLIFFIFFQNSRSTFMITWGKLVDSSGCEEVLQTDDCFGTCENETSCLIAHVNESVCYNCGSSFTSKIQSLDKTQANGNKVGFKAVENNECPASPNSSFVLEDFELIYSEGYWQLESTTVTTTTTETTVTTVNKCPGGKIFTRSTGDWCMIYLFSHNLFEFDDAQRACIQFANGTMSGIDTQEELDYIKTQNDLFKNGYSGEKHVWIGMSRRSECVGDNWNSDVCNPQVPNAYEWTDNFTTGTDMMRNWYKNESRYSNYEQCVVLVFKYDKGILGQLDNYNCEVNLGAIACGHKM